MSYLITGATGFVGGYLLKNIKARYPEVEIWAVYRHNMPDPGLSDINYLQIDMNDQPTLNKIISRYQPRYIIHLAAESSVAASWYAPIDSFNNNVNIFLNLLEAVRLSGHLCRILSVGSSEIYGQLDMSKLPLREDGPTNPISPYAVARAAQEMLSKVYVDGYGLDIVLTRSFNHFGPNQDGRFVIPSFVRRLLERKANDSTDPIKTGDLKIIRDFVDVRDVVRAYVVLLEKGARGSVYNICSGKGHTLGEILSMLQSTVGTNLEAYPDPQLIRPNDNPMIIGDNSKIKKELNWHPDYSLSQSLHDIVASLS